MVNDSLSAAGFCLCAALLAVVLRQYSREQSMLTALAACVAVGVGAMAFSAPLVAEIRDIFVSSGIPDSYCKLLFKALAIAFVTQITTDLCRDCGESAIGSAAEMWGRGALVFLSLPLVRTLLERVGDFL